MLAGKMLLHFFISSCYCASSHNFVSAVFHTQFPNPNFREWNFLIFEAKVSGTFDSICKPTIGLKKRWPSYSSNVLALEGEYVDGGSLSDTVWSRVVIPMADFATAEWPNVDGVKDIYFR